MSHYRRANTAGATYFFTVVTYRRQPFLCDENIRRALRAAINKVRAQYPFSIDAWLLLPNHLHTIWTLPPEDSRFALRWQLIKRYVTLSCGEQLFNSALMSSSKIKHRESTIWQRRYWEHQIRDELDFQRHMDYCHYNPVKHGVVEQVKEWPHSSFHRYVELGLYQENWAGTAILDEGSFGDV